MAEQYLRVIPFEKIDNFRDLGGYKGAGGKTVARRRLYRSGGLLQMTVRDKACLKDEIRLKTVIDLRTPDEIEKIRETRLLEEIGTKYFNIPFRPDDPDYYKKEMELYKTLDNMGQVYLRRISYDSFGRKFIQILEIIAEPVYQPLLFHCAVGKDRTGMMAAMLLGALGVCDDDIIDDYVLSDASMAKIKERIITDPKTPEEIKNFPDFTWRADADTMSLFLSLFKKEYGSVAGYLKKHGSEKTLVKRLEKALLA